jgi:hypothetical protein
MEAETRQNRANLDLPALGSREVAGRQRGGAVSRSRWNWSEPVGNDERRHKHASQNPWKQKPDTTARVWTYRRWTRAK